MYITGGIKNPLINKFTTGGEVNASEEAPRQYAETALERLSNYEINTDPNSGIYTKDFLGKSNKVMVQGETSEDKKNRLEAMSFIRKWYSNPVTQQMIAQNDPINYEEFPVRSSNGKLVTHPHDARRLIVAGTLSNTPIAYMTLPSNIFAKYLHMSNNDPSKNGILINDERPAGYHRSFIHEFDHALQFQIPGLTKPIQYFQHILKPGIVRDPYLDNPREVRSRIMQFRQYHNLSPDKRDYTAEEAEEMQKKTEGLTGGVSDLNRLDPQTLANYLNFLASNDIKATPNLRSRKQDDAAYAKHGNKLKLKQFN